jgi:hypothetical protein
MSAKAKHYFVYGNTAQGFVSKLDSNLTGIEKLCILHGRPGTGKLLMTGAIADACANSGSAPESCTARRHPERMTGFFYPGWGWPCSTGQICTP